MPQKLAMGTGRTQNVRKPSTVDIAGDAQSATTPKEKGKSKEKDTEKDKSKKDARDIMPPPPPSVKPQAILEPEFGALEESLKNVTVTTGQIFKFYSDARRLDIQKYATRPPRSMTSALERELGRYDQICDKLEAHLSRAIAVLQRDLTREEIRIREAEAEMARVRAAEASAADMDVEMINAPEAAVKPTLPSGALAGTGKHPLRRPSKISLSTLHRSPFPLKLDLSSAALRLGCDEGGLNMSTLDNLNALSSLGSMGVDNISGLASPVTLAPKSARPLASGELPPDVLAALASTSGDMQMPDPSQHVDIDLTLEDNLPANMALLDSGSSADKPIELDLDYDVHMSDLPPDLFGEQSGDGTQAAGASADTDMEKLFGPEAAGAASTSDGATAGVDMSMLLSENNEHDDALFASLNAGDNAPGESASGSQPGAGPTHTEGNGDDGGFDYSMFFNDPSNQEHIDMMEHFLKFSNSGTSSDAPESSSNTGPTPSATT